MTVTLKHHKTGEERLINCLGWGYSPKGNVYEFFTTDEKTIHVAAYSVYNWDLIMINN